MCKALGFTNARSAIKNHVFEGDVEKIDTPTAGGPQKMNFLNESGVYALIFNSHKPAAKRFKRWVTSEVLPTIRKTGRYEAPNAPPPPRFTELFIDFVKVAKEAIGLEHNIALISANQATFTETGKNVLALLGQTHLKAEEPDPYLNVTDLGSMVDIPARAMNKLMARAGLQHARGGTSLA